MSIAETNETLGRLDVRAAAIAYPPAQAAIVSGRTRTRIFGAIKSGELKARKDGKATIIEHDGAHPLGRAVSVVASALTAAALWSQQSLQRMWREIFSARRSTRNFCNASCRQNITTASCGEALLFIPPLWFCAFNDRKRPVR